jgi:hypothetical protein
MVRVRLGRFFQPRLKELLRLCRGSICLVVDGFYFDKRVRKDATVDQTTRLQSAAATPTERIICSLTPAIQVPYMIAAMSPVAKAPRTPMIRPSTKLSLGLSSIIHRANFAGRFKQKVSN